MKLFENVSMFRTLLPFEQFRLYCDMPEGTLMGDYEQGLVMEAAEKALQEEIPQLYATLYMRFMRDGNRSEYEASYFARRRILRALTLGEMLEKKGRFLDKIIDVAWLICEETTWVIPAHNHILDQDKQSLLTRQVEGESTIIDLFAAETGAELANTLYYLRDALDAVCPSVTARMDYCIERHILTPFEKYVYWWGGFTDGPLNNWNPWIISNLLVTIGVEVKDRLRRVALCEKAIYTLDRFVDTYSIDGGCDEGPSYWTAAAASLYDCLEVLYDLTGGKVSCFDNELIRNMCDYFRKAFISGDYVMNFADAPATLNIGGVARRINRMGRRVHIPEMSAFASYAAYRKGDAYAPFAMSVYEGYSNIRNLYEQIPAYTGGGICVSADFPGIVVAVRREKEDFDSGVYFAIKGGTNGENHNHNDVGSFVLYKDGKPVIVDLGVGTYSRKTFSEERYTIKAMTSAYHSVAQIGGIDQHNGKEFACANPVFTKEGLSIDIEGAYPKEAGLSKYNRTGTLCGGTVTVCDTLVLEKPTQVVWNFICLEKPVISGSHVTIGNASLSFPDTVSASIDPYIFDDPRFNATWNRDRAYRVQFTAEVIKDSFTFTIQ